MLVVIPARNEEKSIANTLDTLANQTVPPEKVIVIDDGSTDNTSQILQKYISQSFQLIIKSRPHRKKEKSLVGTPGIALTFNIGFKVAKKFYFDFIMILGADFLLENRYIEKILLEFAKDPSLAIASGQSSQMTINPTHARGSGRLIHSRFWKYYGERYPVIYGWEDDCLIQCRRMGLKVRSFPYIQSSSLRKDQGTIDFMNWGRAARAMRYHPIIVVLRAGRFLFLQRYGLNATVRFLAGFLSSPIPECVKPVQRQNREFVRQHQLRQIPRKLGSMLSFSHSSNKSQ